VPWPIQLKEKNLCQGDWKARMMVRHSIELKGGTPQLHQCSINGMEWVWINPWSAVSNCGSF